MMNDVQEEYQKMVKKNCEIVWFTSIACLKFKVMVMVMKRGIATAIIYLLIIIIIVIIISGNWLPLIC